jgi:hypothetical protein
MERTLAALFEIARDIGGQVEGSRAHRPSPAGRRSAADGGRPRTCRARCRASDRSPADPDRRLIASRSTPSSARSTVGGLPPWSAAPRSTATPAPCAAIG